jgi:hypothetical protein
MTSLQQTFYLQVSLKGLELIPREILEYWEEGVPQIDQMPCQL